MYATLTPSTPRPVRSAARRHSSARSACTEASVSSGSTSSKAARLSAATSSRRNCSRTVTLPPRLGTSPSPSPSSPLSSSSPSSPSAKSEDDGAYCRSDLMRRRHCLRCACVA
eukprot:scaffold85121_cov48-Phaeocystis_antarctica.AAC.1